MSEVVASTDAELMDRVGILVLKIDDNDRVAACNGAASAIVGQVVDDETPLLDELVFRGGGGAGETSFAALLGGEVDRAVIRLANGQGRSTAVLFTTPVRLDDGTGPGLRVLAGMPVSDRQALRLDAEVSAKLGVLGSLAHHVVHELNQPLSVIRMAAGTTRRKLAMGDVDAGYLDDRLARIDQQCLKAAAIVDYMRVYVPRDHKSRVLHDIRHCVNNALQLIAPRFRTRNVVVNTALGEEELPLESNEMQLEPIFLGILDFIEKRTPDGGAGGVEVTAGHADGSAWISFEDACGPLDEAGMSRLFLRSDMPGSSALGMGLSLSRDLAREIGGDLEVGSSGVGLRYVVTLPLSESQPED